MYLLHAVYVTRVTRTIDTGTCTYHPFAMVPVRYLAYGPYGGMTPFVVRGNQRDAHLLLLRQASGLRAEARKELLLQHYISTIRDPED